MEKTISEQDQEFIELFKKLTREQKDKVHIVVKWLENASKTDTRKFGKLMASKDKKAIDAFVESLKTGKVSI